MEGGESHHIPIQITGRVPTKKKFQNIDES